MATTIEDLLGSYSDILESAINFTTKHSLPLVSYEIDHLCYRCDSKAQYQHVCKEFISSGLGSMLLESMIADRPISIVSFTPPLQYKEWTVRCLELTCPKAGRAHKSGFEHLEVVVDSTNTHGFHHCEHFLQDFASSYPNVTFDLKAIKKDINADICISTDEGYSIKYHARPIYEVCQYEKDSNHFISVPSDYFD